MNILIIANHFAICSARYATDAFKRLGHDVRHVGPDMGRDIWGLTLPAEYAWKPDGNTLAFGGGDFDIIIIMDSDTAILNEVEFLKGNWPHPVIVWGVDSHVRRYEREHFDHYFLAHKGVSIQPFDDQTTWLPCAYDPVWFTPSPIPFAEREYDVCCLGVMYPKRRELVDAMRKAGLKVLAGTGLVYEAYRDAHWNSRVALCSSVAGDVAQRVFEAAAMGCAVLSDMCRDFEILRPKTITLYSTVENAISRAKSLLENDARWARFRAEESQAWAKPHSWDARAQVVVDWWEATYGAK